VHMRTLWNACCVTQLFPNLPQVELEFCGQAKIRDGTAQAQRMADSMFFKVKDLVKRVMLK